MSTVGGSDESEPMDERAGSGSLDDERELDTVEPGPESLELRLVLLCGRSGFKAAELNGGMTPNGRPDGPLGTAPAELGRRLVLFATANESLSRWSTTSRATNLGTAWGGA